MANKLILRSFQSPGDIVMLSAAVRDLHLAYPNRFQTDVRTSAPAVWENNPYITPLDDKEPDVTTLDMHYPAIHQSDRRPYHFIHGYVQYLEQQLGLQIPVTAFRGDIYLSADEQSDQPPGKECGVPEEFWIIVAGGKFDFTAKWWDPKSFQAVVEYFRDRICFVQCGESGHWHPRLDGVIDLVGQTTLRQFIRLVYHASGVLCPVTLAMHLAAAVPAKPGARKLRPCVVVAGGREPAHWEAYSHHQFLHTVGTLTCCAEGGCWRSRCQLVNDGDAKDRHHVCEFPVPVGPDLRIAKCMAMISPMDVAGRLQWYVEPDTEPAAVNREVHEQPVQIKRETPPASGDQPAEHDRSRGRHRLDVAIDFRHGLGDAIQLTAVLRHLKYYHPEWSVDVAALVGKHSALRGLCRNVVIRNGRGSMDRRRYARHFALDWDECTVPHADVPSTKVAQCLTRVFKLKPIPEFCRYTICRSQEADTLARQYLQQVCQAEPDAAGRYPAVLIHYQANTSNDKKDLSHDLIRAVCDVVLETQRTPVILDWDHRSPLPDGRHIFNPDANHPIWGGHGTGDAEVLASLIENSQLMIGVDSGPLHVAGATSTDTIGVWTHHHPVHYFDLADNVIHLVPSNHGDLVRGPEAGEFFSRRYRHQTYQNLSIALPALVESRLTDEPYDRVANRRFLAQLSSHAFDRRYHEEHEQAGLDYLAFGQWQQDYGQWLVESLRLKGKRVLDVGCACGAIARGLQQAGAMVDGIDLNEYMIQLGREKWPDMGGQLHVCDAVNLHLYGDDQWDAVHCAQSAEHWKPNLVPHILRELNRVVVPGGVFFCSLDSQELVARQRRDPRNEDPTHVCIRPMSWWCKQLNRTGWEDASLRVDAALRTHPKSFFNRYDWDWFAAVNSCGHRVRSCHTRSEPEYTGFLNRRG